MDENPNTISVDSANSLLHQLDFSCGDVSYRAGDRNIWQVFARREGNQILVRADSQREAWIEAARQAQAINE